MNDTGKIKAAFFDRDGTLIKDVDYLSSLEQIEIIPKALQLCLCLQKLGYKLFVVTNQSGVARGFFDESFVQKTHLYLQKILEQRGIFIQKFYYCPHHPTKAKLDKYLQNCECRKPKPGMLLQAAQEFDVDLSKSLMFGDKLIDIQVGNAVGCRSFYIQDILSIVDEKEKVKEIIKGSL